jgi:hypothetical protein
MTLLVIGTTFINLDHVAYVCRGDNTDALFVYFALPQKSWITFEGDEAAALQAYLETYSIDVVLLYEDESDEEEANP